MPNQTAETVTITTRPCMFGVACEKVEYPTLRFCRAP